VGVGTGEGVAGSGLTGPATDGVGVATAGVGSGGRAAAAAAKGVAVAVWADTAGVSVNRVDGVTVGAAATLPALLVPCAAPRAGTAVLVALGRVPFVTVLWPTGSCWLTTGGVTTG
jgi:hypothetical protein